MSAWSVVSRVARPHIASYLEDLTPFAATHSALRCCSHFDKYMTCMDQDWLTPFTQDSCARCLAEFTCHVMRHQHVQSGFGICGLLYVGVTGNPKELASRLHGGGSTETSYLWVPSRGAVLCHTCCQNAEEITAFFENWKNPCVGLEEEPYYETQDWVFQNTWC